MDEIEYRATLTKEELEERALLLPFKIMDIEVYEHLAKYSQEFSKTYDELINLALVRLFADIEAVNRLRLKSLGK